MIENSKFMILTLFSAPLMQCSLFWCHCVRLVATSFLVLLFGHRVGRGIGKRWTDYGSFIPRIGNLRFQSTHHALCIYTCLVLSIKVSLLNAYSGPTKNLVPVPILQENWYTNSKIWSRSLLRQI